MLFWQLFKSTISVWISIQHYQPHSGWQIEIDFSSTTMSTYEEDHNIQTTHPTQPRRSNQTLSSHLEQFLDGSDLTEFDSTTSTAESQLRLLIDALHSLNNAEVGEDLIEQLSNEGNIKGVSQEFIDSLERVPKKCLKADQTCSICTNDFLDDPYPLVVKLNCSGSHKFDLECIAPWLKVHSTCPLCRKNLLDKKDLSHIIKSTVDEDEEEEEENWEMYG